MATIIEGFVFGSGATWRDITPESRVVRTGRPPGVAADAPPPDREVVPQTRWGGRRGRPRTPAGALPPALAAFREACERTAVDGVVLRETLRAALGVSDHTLNTYASRLRKLQGAEGFPFKIGGSPWQQNTRLLGRKGVAR